MYCSKCLNELVEKNVPIKAKRGKWNFLNHLKDGDSILVGTEDEYNNARRTMYYKNIPLKSAKMPDGSGWRIWKVEQDTAGQL